MGQPQRLFIDGDLLFFSEAREELVARRELALAAEEFVVVERELDCVDLIEEVFVNLLEMVGRAFKGRLAVEDDARDAHLRLAQ